MKTAAEAKRRPLRCSEAPMAGDGSMSAVSITKRAKLEEPAAAGGRCSPNLLPPNDGAGTPKPEKPSKEEYKRSKKKKKKKKKSNHNQEKWIEEVASKIEEHQKRIEKLEEQVGGGDDDVLKEKSTKEKKNPEQGDVVMADITEPPAEHDKANKGKKKMQQVSQADMESRLYDEIFRYMIVDGILTFEDVATRVLEMTWLDPSTQTTVFAERLRDVENKASVLRQYRTSGHAFLDLEVADDDE